MENTEVLKRELAKALQWENAHASFTTATENLDLETLGARADGLPYTIWQLAEHIRFTQRDILDFCLDQNYSAPTWPDDYWPKEKAPSSIDEWYRCRENVKHDRREIVELISDPERDLFKPFPHGDGQHLFREALLVIDHEAYHTGEIIVLRRLLGKWE